MLRAGARRRLAIAQTLLERLRIGSLAGQRLLHHLHAPGLPSAAQGPSVEFAGGGKPVDQCAAP